jgi:hypothetical protein
MTTSDVLTYIIAFFLLAYFKKKFHALRDFAESCSTVGWLIRNIVLFISTYIIVWSVLNWYFYINFFILLGPQFNYNPSESFHIAMTITNLYSSMGFYGGWLIHKAMGGTHIELMNELVNQIKKVLNAIGGVEDDGSALSTLNDVLHLFY